jgi:pyrroloquinoline quinone biosynthesis protein E
MSIRDIWLHSAAFNKFRGYDWMKEPCRSCPEKTKDFGGCRCQAYLFTGDMTAADPVCSKSPHRNAVIEAIASARSTFEAGAPKPLVFRNTKNSRSLSD